MDAIFDWVKSIVFYLILLTVVTNLLPSKKYEKYVKLFTGMLMVIIVIKPITQVFSVDEIFDRNFLEMLGEGESFSIDDTTGISFENVQEEQLLEEYERQVKAFATTQAESLGMEVVKLQSKIEEQEGVLVPKAIQMEVIIEESDREEQTQDEPIEIHTIKITDVVARERTLSGKEQTRQLKIILMEYYGLEEEQIQIVVS